MRNVLRRISRRSAALALALIGLAAVGVGVAVATIPANGQIDACFMKSTGTLRVIDATVTKCAAKEQSLAWNVQGPKGDPGAPGTARAYAFVRSDGTIDRASSANVASVRFIPEVPDTATTDGNPPTYCVAFTFTPAVVVATAEGFGTIMGETPISGNAPGGCQPGEVMIRATVEGVGFIPSAFSMMAN